MNVKVALSFISLTVLASLANAAPQYFHFPGSPADELHNAITSLTYGLHYRLAQVAQAAAAQSILSLGPPAYYQSVPIVDDFDLRLRPNAIAVTSGSGNKKGFASVGFSNRPNGVSASAAAVSTSG